MLPLFLDATVITFELLCTVGGDIAFRVSPLNNLGAWLMLLIY
jgi:hypothetical protein